MSSKVLLNEKEVERMLSLSSDLPPLDEVAAPSLVASPARAAAVPPPVDRMSKRGSSETLVYEESKAHLLKPTSNNPMPTAVPPPIAATAGTLGVRHVLIIIGLPERGKPFIARRLERYLSFFHGAEVQVFNIVDYQHGPAGCNENAEALFADLQKFMGRRNDAAAHPGGTTGGVPSRSISSSLRNGGGCAELRTGCVKKKALRRGSISSAHDGRIARRTPVLRSGRAVPAIFRRPAAVYFDPGVGPVRRKNHQRGAARGRSRREAHRRFGADISDH